VNKRNLIVSLGAAAAGLAVYATFIEPRWLQLTRTRIHIRDLPAPLEGLRIALLTDMHAGGATPLSVVRRAAALAMRERPHVIALTGDFAVDDAKSFSGVLGALSELSAPLGMYAVPGNHDYVVGIETWRREIAAHPTIVDLTNTAVVRKVRDARICIAGVDDLYYGTPRLMLPPPENRDVTILLAHTPDQGETSRRTYDQIDLILSGHTHGGQIRLPLFGPPISSADHPELYDHGLRRRPWTQVYTSRGIGTVGVPFRFLTRPEVAILELTGSARPPAPRSTQKFFGYVPRRATREEMLQKRAARRAGATTRRS
jgi:predicted MPP superfamily phosphohydrolase